MGVKEFHLFIAAAHNAYGLFPGLNTKALHLDGRRLRMDRQKVYFKAVMKRWLCLSTPDFKL